MVGDRTPTPAAVVSRVAREGSSGRAEPAVASQFPTVARRAYSHGEDALGVDVAAYLASRVGETLPTLTGRPNTILAVDERSVLVGTERSPRGRRVPLAWVQAAVDALYAGGELAVDVETVGYRSAFIGAVLASLPGTIGTLRPRTVRLLRPR